MSNLCFDFIDDLQTKQLEKLEQWFFEESEVWLPPSKTIKGKRAILILFRAIFKKYSQLNWRVEKVHDLGGGQFIFNTYSWGQFITGQKYENHILTEINFNELNQITWLSDYFKDTAIFAQR